MGVSQVRDLCTEGERWSAMGGENGDWGGCLMDFQITDFARETIRDLLFFLELRNYLWMHGLQHTGPDLSFQLAYYTLNSPPLELRSD